MRLDDPDRLRSIDELGLVDTPREEVFDRAARLASALLGAPVSLVSIVTDDRQFFKSEIGLPEPWASRRETSLTHSFCQYVVTEEEPLVVSDAREDEVLADNLAIEDLDVISYCGVPLRDPEGRALGSFCVIDHEPREWSVDDVDRLRDLAELVRSELEIREAIQQAAQAVKDRENLLATIVHDLKNPLATVIGAAETLRERQHVLPEQAQWRMLDMVRDQAQRATRMIEGLVNVNRSEAPDEFDVRGTLRRVRDSLEVGRGVGRVSLDLPDEPVMLLGREDVVARVATNLIVNAVTHAGPGAEVRVTVAAHQHGIELHVSDDGVGMAEEQVPLLFEPFRRGSSPTVDGMGLGLHIVRMLAEEHDGHVEVDSTLGEGTTFTVRFGELSGRVTRPHEKTTTR